MSSPLRNNQGHISGAKLVLVAACVLSLAWLARDLIVGRELTEWHTVLLGVLLVVGLINRMSARGHLRVRIKDVEVETNGN